MKFKRRLLFTFAALSLPLSNLSASGLDFSALVGTGVHQLHVAPYASGENDGSYYVGLTFGWLDNDTTHQFEMFCVDFLGNISVPTSYNVLVDPLGSGYFSDNAGSSQANLQLMSALGDQFGITPSGNATADSDIQHDIWNLSGGNFTPATAGMAADLALATTALPSINFNTRYVLTLATPGQYGQEFMPALVAAPEPPAITTVAGGAGLFLISLLVKRRRSKM